MPGTPASFTNVSDTRGNLPGEVLDGEVVDSPEATPQGLRAKAALQTAIAQVYGEATKGGRGWWLVDRPKLQMGRNMLIPDLAGWRHERTAKVPETSNVVLAPDWACEVLSPTGAIIVRTRKLPIYALHRVCWVWIVDPNHRTIEVLWLEGDEYVVACSYGGTEKARIPPFDDTEFELAALWEPFSDFRHGGQR